jgi:uncharacterized protein YigE (DUF2233 family)
MRLFRLLSILFPVLFSTACSQTEAHYRWAEVANKSVDVVIVDQLKNLRLFLNDANHQPYHNFKSLHRSLESCSTLQFAMNAGMYHADYQPVGLYIERGQQYSALNLEHGYGNFFKQPNGVFAWNAEIAIVQTTQQYAVTKFAADYATQSGPMLVIDGKIIP